MKKIALAALLAAAPAAQIYDPCVGYHRTCINNVCWWQWDWYQLHVALFAHVEIVPVGTGLGLVCLFQGESRTSPTGWVSRINQNSSWWWPCSKQIQPMWRHGIWWMDAAPRPGETLWHQLRQLADLYTQPTGFEWTYQRPNTGVSGWLSDDLLVYETGNPNWTRHPTYWAVLIAPQRGYW